MSIRPASVTGQFYPDDPNEIEAMIKQFNTLLESSGFTAPAIIPKALICPHAGYIFSGFTANAAYRLLPEDTQRVVVLGPSHRVYLPGASVALYDSYETPFGDIEIDKELSMQLQQRFAFVSFYDEAHREHSTETQMPFIKHYFPRAKVVELVYGDITFSQLQEVIAQVGSLSKTAVVISSDLSHFYDKEQAQKLDHICMRGIENLDTSMDAQGCEACGIKGIQALLAHAGAQGWQARVLDYRTSADMTRDESSVVGYTSAVVGEKE